MSASHHGGHHPRLAHHFDDMEQQREAGTLGMWLFLVTEIMFFGGMFLAYTIFRARFPREFVLASHELDIVLGGFNTAVLIGSSLTMAMAVWSAQTGRKKALVGFLVATMMLGTVFLGVKVVEYRAKFEHHLVPGASFNYEPHDGTAAAGHGVEAGADGMAAAGRAAEMESAAEAGHVAEADGVPAADRGATGEAPTWVPRQGKVQLFFFLYFALTGVHALHMVIGLVALTLLTIWAIRGSYDKQWHSHIELTGLYWHFVDIAWIFIFPLLYLIGRH